MDGKLLFVMAITMTLLNINSYAKEQNKNTYLNAQETDLIEFSRQGHLDVNAEKRALMWQVLEPNALKSLDVKVVKIAEGTMKPETLFRSNEQSGQIDLMELGKGPGLYAILSESVDVNGKVSRKGMRLSYTETNKDCPINKAWWPNQDTVDFQDKGDAKESKLDNNSTSNLVHLSRVSSHAIVAKVSKLIPCPTEAGSLFTYVVFDDVQTLQQEGDSNTPEQLVLRIPGGMAHGRVEVVTDAPIFRQEDQVLLFLSRNPQRHMPISGGVDGVMLIEKDNTLRSYSGPNIVAVDKQFEIGLDEGYQINPEHIRHYDPNMRAVINNPEPADGITKKAVNEVVKSMPTMSVDTFLEHLRLAWQKADELGRLPNKVDLSEKPHYNQLPVQQKLSKLQ